MTVNAKGIYELTVSAEQAETLKKIVNSFSESDLAYPNAVLKMFLFTEHGEWVLFSWPEPVDLALLTQIQAWFGRQVVNEIVRIVVVNLKVV